MKRSAIFYLAFVVGGCCITSAAPESAIAKDGNRPRGVTESATASGTPLSSDKLISVDFPNEERAEILRKVANLYGYTVEIPNAVQERTSLKLHNVAWWQIFSETLSPIGLNFYPEGKTIKIIGLDDPPPPLVFREYRCIFGPPEELREIVLHGLDKERKGSAGLTGRIVKVQTTWRHAEQLDQIFERWDRPRKQFPNRIYWPATLPPEVLNPPHETNPDALEKWMPSEMVDAPAVSEIFTLNWVDARVLAGRIKPLLVGDRDSLQINFGENAFVVTTNGARQRLIARVCTFLDDRKWYLEPAKRENPVPTP